MYGFETEVDEIAVQFAYLFILGREPENEGIVRSALTPRRNIRQLRQATMGSPEYRKSVDDLSKERTLQNYLICKFEAFEDYRNSNILPSERIRVIQTADPTRYKKLLEASSIFNKEYARLHGLEYESYVGIKRGVHPHHAMYNRTHMLSELIDDNFSGWVLYVDADAIVSKPDFDIRAYLSGLRQSNKAMCMHRVGLHNENHSWWNVNDGCFAVDLSSPLAISMMKAWCGIYRDLYTLQDYENAQRWEGDIIDDQTALWKVLQAFDARTQVELADMQGVDGFIKQVLRKAHSSIPGEEELVHRQDELLALGKDYYGNLP